MLRWLWKPGRAWQWGEEVARSLRAHEYELSAESVHKYFILEDTKEQAGQQGRLLVFNRILLMTFLC